MRRLADYWLECLTQTGKLQHFHATSIYIYILIAFICHLEVAPLISMSLCLCGSTSKIGKAVLTGTKEVIKSHRNPKIITLYMRK